LLLFANGDGQLTEASTDRIQIASKARIAQLLSLLKLRPEIQEHLKGLSSSREIQFFSVRKKKLRHGEISQFTGGRRRFSNVLSRGSWS
jgi:hypothetical protein